MHRRSLLALAVALGVALVAAPRYVRADEELDLDDESYDDDGGEDAEQFDESGADQTQQGGGGQRMSPEQEALVREFNQALIAKLMEPTSVIGDECRGQLETFLQASQAGNPPAEPFTPECNQKVQSFAGEFQAEFMASKGLRTPGSGEGAVPGSDESEEEGDEAEAAADDGGNLRIAGGVLLVLFLAIGAFAAVVIKRNNDRKAWMAANPDLVAEHEAKKKAQARRLEKRKARPQPGDEALDPDAPPHEQRYMSEEKRLRKARAAGRGAGSATDSDDKSD